MNDLIHPIIAYYPAITATDGIIIRQLLWLWARPKNWETPSIIQLLLIQNTWIDDYYFLKCNSIGVAPIFLLPFSSFLYMKFMKLFQQKWKRVVEKSKLLGCDVDCSPLFSGRRGWWTKCKPNDILRLWMEEADYKYGIRPHHAGSFFVQAQANFSPSWRGHISSVLPLRKYTQYKDTHITRAMKSIGNTK